MQMYHDVIADKVDACHSALMWQLSHPSSKTVREVAVVYRRLMNISYRAFAVHAHIPMIKFVGARFPRPNFSRVASSPTKVLVSSPALSGKFGSTGQTQRRPSISEEQLPERFRRPLLSQEECDAINTHGFQCSISLLVNSIRKVLVFRPAELTDYSTDQRKNRCGPRLQ